MTEQALRQHRVSEVKQFSSDKIYKHEDRVRDWLLGKNPFAVTVEFMPTFLCNHKCPECFGYAGQCKDACMTRDQIFDLITQLKMNRARGVTFTGGGEPLMNKNTVSAIQYAADGMDVALITNGGLIKSKHMAEKLVRSCTWIRVSLDAGTPEMHEWTHGVKKDFENVAQGIRYLVEAKRETGSYCTIGTGYLTGKETNGGMLDFVKVSKVLGVDYCQFRPFLKVFSGKNNLSYDASEIYSQIEQCLKYREPGFNVLYSKHKYDDMYDHNFDRMYDRCHGHQFATVIGADLKMWVCCHFTGVDKYCIGDLNQKSIKEVWQSRERLDAVLNINLVECPRYCRCDSFNKILFRCSEPVEHENFL